MARSLACWLCLVATLPLVPAELLAQRPGGRLFVRAVPEVGVRAGWDWDQRAVTIGGQVRIPSGLGGGALVPSGDFLVTGEGTQWQLNLDLLTPGGPGGLLTIGVGAALQHRRLERYGIEDPRGEHTKLGFNLVAGIGVPAFLRLPVAPYAEFRITAVSKYDASQYLTLGVNLPLGSRSPRR